MLEQIIQLVTILFLLSMVCERIADFLKHYLSDSYLFKIRQKEFVKVGNTTTKFHPNDAQEDARKFRILKINVFSGILLAFILKADLIQILNDMEHAGTTLGWNNLYLYKESYITRHSIEDIEWYKIINYWLLPFGIILTGCFISFGSKFWHDLLDILYQIKNAKRVLADPETYKADNVNAVKKLFDTYQSDFIKAAYLEAKTKYMVMESVKAIGIKSDEKGYYFEITVYKNTLEIEPVYQHLLNDGTFHSIRVKTVVITDKIMAQSTDLSSRIFDMNQPDKWGTLGVLVKPLDNSSNKRYLLTCCHNVVNPVKTILDKKNSIINAGSKVDEDSPVVPLGTVFMAIRDYQIDAALIEIDPQKINNYIRDNGIPSTAKKLLDSDRNNLKVYLYGAKSGSKEGVITSLFCDPKITYGYDNEFTIVDTIAISNNGKSLTQGGDSGACVVDGRRNVIGLVVAGSSTTTYVIPIQTLLTKLNVQLA